MTFRRATLTLARTDEGTIGTLEIKDVGVLDVRGWEKTSERTVTFEVQYDGEWAAYLERLAGKMVG